ncbi:hypothetical protein EC9_36300 [Rosistilla ulvae]|uniref:Uncharacterized protein n=1 Tax=Rosistilla ulvae TaxID=1930277 RepID=A0A517M3I8_9BACT|nr:hypothetical protein EC9_36300 [Rosistilla ulvae]
MGTSRCARVERLSFPGRRRRERIAFLGCENKLGREDRLEAGRDALGPPGAEKQAFSGAHGSHRCAMSVLVVRFHLAFYTQWLKH